jgi:2-methylcitrate dehydratase PrpD
MPVTRRSLLKRAGAAAASGALFPGRLRASLPPTVPPVTKSDVTGELSTYMSEAANRELPPEVEDKAKEHILDTLAAMISGAKFLPAETALRFVRAYGGAPVATVVGTTLCCGPIEAALANGMRAHSDETDDSHSPSHSHPGCAIVPAALAAGEKFAISGAHFVRAVALGYDVGPRVTMTLGGLDYQMQSHRSDHSIAGTFGACAAAASTASLNPQQMRWVLDYAAQQASGIAAWQRDTQHIEKSLVFGGFPARNGVTAALLIQLGATGVDDIFFGSDNFFAAFSPQSNPEGLIDGLGRRYEITRTNIKKWPVGSPIQAPLDALQMILKQHPFSAANVRQINVRIATSEAHTVNNRDMPDICLQHMIAVMMVDGTVTFHSAHSQQRMRDPVILAARAKVNLISDAGLEMLYPQLVAVVEVILNDGRQFSQRVDAVRGTVANPMSREEVTEKARDLIAPYMSAAKCNQLINAVFRLEDLPNIRDLEPLLQCA